MRDEEFQANLGISRRTLIKRGAVVGGTLVWAAPVVQSLSAPAFAAGSPQCSYAVTNNQSGGDCREFGVLTPSNSPANEGKDCCSSTTAPNFECEYDFTPHSSPQACQ